MNFHFGFFRQNGKSILQHEFQNFERRVHIIREGRIRSIKPYYEPISYEVTHEKDITAVGKPGKYKNAGFAVSTGMMNEKKAVYIIPEIDRTKECITIPEKDIRAFKIRSEKEREHFEAIWRQKVF